MHTLIIQNDGKYTFDGDEFQDVNYKIRDNGLLEFEGTKKVSTVEMGDAVVAALSN